MDNLGCHLDHGINQTSLSLSSHFDVLVFTLAYQPLKRPDK